MAAPARYTPGMRTLCPMLALASLAACSSATPDPRGVGRDETLLQVSASGRAESRPDEARFTAGVTTLGASAAAASAANNEVMGKVTGALDSLGIKDDDIQTRSITLSRIDYGRDRGRFQANNMVEVRIRDVAKAGAAIAAATQAGANVLSGPDLRVSDAEKARNSAYAAAYNAARARADAYAAAAGLEVARVLTIRDEGMSGPSPYYPMAEQAMNAAPPPVAPPPVRPGINTEEVRVRVDFALTKR